VDMPGVGTSVQCENVRSMIYMILWKHDRSPHLFACGTNEQIMSD
jgi:hypothetical protein